MATLYYMIIEGRQAGPFPAEALKAQGLTPETYVWREGLQNWVTASQLPELDYLFRENPPAAGPLRTLHTARTTTVSRARFLRIPTATTAATENRCRIPTGSPGPLWRPWWRSC